MWLLQWRENKGLIEYVFYIMVVVVFGTVPAAPVLMEGLGYAVHHRRCSCQYLKVFQKSSATGSVCAGLSWRSAL